MRHVLFLCSHNAGRSQMAQAFFQQIAPADVRAESAGTEPADEVWPVVREAMREVGIDLADHRPRRLDLEMQYHADWAVTMGCGDACPYVPTRVDDWPVDDPAGKSLEEVRVIRDEIQRRVQTLVVDHLDVIRGDRTAHELRLARLLPSLHDEFGADHPAERIRACADEALGHYADSPVRSFVLVLAHRSVRECLRGGSCAPTAA